MLYIYWEFQVRADKIAEFERRYGGRGDWAVLFRCSPGYQGTTLGRSKGASGHYLVTDTWDNADSFARFKKDFHEAYVELDRICESLTINEKHIGNFEVL